ncbi:MAG: glycosyltransferase [Bacteroidetes bacterium]|nr:MAG: glycosyltransferase [Bacteroidota bacterium]
MNNAPSRLLITPLNWGLGHATRCIPIIQDYLQKGWEVNIAGDGDSLELLKKEFPTLTYFPLPGYDINYRFNNMYFNILFQMPKIVIAALKENFAVREIVRTQQIDLLISDNRFGCFSKSVKSIFITHQVNILVGFKPLQRLVNFFNHWVIKRFDECWIPDLPPNRLGGKLSDNSALPNSRYIGLLSRMKKLNTPVVWDLVVVLSGPEPQRSKFENLVLKQLAELSLKSVVVQGKPGKKIHRSIDENTRLISYATSAELNEIMCASRMILCRSGYSSLMDLAALGKKAILVPTPGQTEQEYLANHLSEQGIFYFQQQKHFNLSEALVKGQNFSGLETGQIK